MAAGLASDTTNPRLLQERIEETQAQIAKLQDELEKYADVARTIADLPKKLTHQVMVPLGKRAMMPGKIVRSNEILAHLGDEYFAWQSASSAVTTIERKKKNIRAQIIDEENALSELTEKKSSVDNLFDIKKLYEEENIREIQEPEEDSDKPVPKATEEDIEEYFEIEEEERRKEEATEWSWDEMMRRMEELEAREASGDGDENEEKKTEEPDAAMQVADLKAKGNNAFARRKFRDAVEFYTQAIALEPTSHILYGNRSAAYHRMKKYAEALEDANYAIEIDDTWVKGHYRKACALASMQRYKDAAEAFEHAFELCPTDASLEEKAQEMRDKLAAQREQKPKPISAVRKEPPAPVAMASSSSSSSFTNVSNPLPPVATTSSNIPVTSIPAPAFSSSSAAFSGSIMERDILESAPPVVNVPRSQGAGRQEPQRTAAPITAPSASSFAPRSRFAGNNISGDVVSFEPIGEPQPVKRVSRFKAARGGQ
uniref:Hsp70-Hsp90 organising protein n=1 Tax=Globisporangium ultimum (strain ATCC 200006 / CBS 805.95 / DAOM BR144) TaxID=431595 RepID=K3WL84_GLOUD